MDIKSLAHPVRTNITEAVLIEAIAEDEATTGRTMTPRERESFARGFFAQEYGDEIRRLMALGVEEPGEDDGS